MVDGMVVDARKEEGCVECEWENEFLVESINNKFSAPNLLLTNCLFNLFDSKRFSLCSSIVLNG